MCVPDNSVDLYTATCPMCKVFRHTGRCPHKNDVCRNRNNHPRHDVVYIANAEVSTFKGCGFCKWASMNPPPPPSKSGFNNPGWPGCCRPPHTSELDKIPPADWPAVHTVHRTPIPHDIKQLLDSLKMFSGSSATSPTSPSNLLAFATSHFGSPTGSKDTLKCAGAVAGTPERKTIARANSSPNGTVRSATQKSRGSLSGSGAGANGGHSPQMKQARLASGAAPGTSPAGNAISPTESCINLNMTRRTGSDGQKPPKRIEGFRTTPPASLRKLTADGEQHLSATRPSLTSATLAALGTPEKEQTLKRRASVAGTGATPLAVATNRVNATPKTPSKPLDRDLPIKIHGERDKSENTGLEKGLKALSVSSKPSDASSEGGSRSSSDGTSTVTSEGGFTDYLSDESEEELQRQAEIRAALLEQNRAEEQEFRAARRQLANVDLHPPQAWTMGRKAIHARNV